MYLKGCRVSGNNERLPTLRFNVEKRFWCYTFERTEDHIHTNNIREVNCPFCIEELKRLGLISGASR